LKLGCELTGDTHLFGMDIWGEAKNTQIMYVHLHFVYFLFHLLDIKSNDGMDFVTMPVHSKLYHPQAEKWDSITRNWYNFLLS